MCWTLFIDSMINLKQFTPMALICVETNSPLKRQVAELTSRCNDIASHLDNIDIAVSTIYYSSTAT